MSEERNDKDLRNFFQNRFENEEQEPPREVWMFVKKTVPLKTTWWKLALYYFSGTVVVLLSTFFIYKLSVGTAESKRPGKNEQVELEDSSLMNQKKEDSTLEQPSVRNEKIIPDPERVETLTGSDPDKSENQIVNKKQSESTSGVNKKSMIKPSQQRKMAAGKNKPINFSNEEVEIVSGNSKNNAKQNNDHETKEIENRGTEEKEGTDLSNPKNEDGTLVKEEATNLPDKDTLLLQEKSDSTVVAPEDTLSKLNPSGSSVPPVAKAKSKWTMELYFGLGRNTRTIVGTFDGNNLLNVDFADRRFRMRNTLLGFGLSYALTNYFSVQTGMNVGSNRAKSRVFQKQFVKSTGDDYQLNTVEGEARLAAAELDQYYHTSDTVELGVRFNHHSTYYSIPISCKLSYPKTFVSPYLRLGSSFDFEMGRKTTIDIIKNDQTTNHPIVKRKVGLGRSVQGLLGFGVSTQTKFGLNVFIEQQFSFAITPYIIRPTFRVRNGYAQLRFGFSYNF